ncbi:MAG: calmodulin-binding protein [Planctomycetota bacterium]|nr:calmodulin-binding protein [Planctomycetota bacterium]MDA1179821.1 calmodulin-binding protein [Planctomycetota bacterium]
MFSRTLGIICCVVCLHEASSTATAQQAYGRSWNTHQGSGNWDRFYHYPYVYYPQNYWGQEYYKSSDSMYFRYPQEMRIPVYNKKWHNEYPSKRLYHSGHQFNLDVF